MPQEPARKRSLCRIGAIPVLAAVRQSRRRLTLPEKRLTGAQCGNTAGVLTIYLLASAIGGIIGGGLSALGGIASAAGSGQTSCEAHRGGGRSISGNIAGSGIPPVDQS